MHRLKFIYIANIEFLKHFGSFIAIKSNNKFV
jgi:hypothetical protein